MPSLLSPSTVRITKENEALIAEALEVLGWNKNRLINEAIAVAVPILRRQKIEQISRLATTEPAATSRDVLTVPDRNLQSSPIQSIAPVKISTKESLQGVSPEVADRMRAGAIVMQRMAKKRTREEAAKKAGK